MVKRETFFNPILRFLSAVQLNQCENMSTIFILFMYSFLDILVNSVFNSLISVIFLFHLIWVIFVVNVIVINLYNTSFKLIMLMPYMWSNLFSSLLFFIYLRKGWIEILYFTSETICFIHIDSNLLLSADFKEKSFDIVWFY